MIHQKSALWGKISGKGLKNRGLIDAMKSISTNIPEIFFDWVSEIIIPSLTERSLDELGDRIGEENNPLGAELTTLQLMKTRELGVQWVPEEDQLVLLVSETRKGKAAARLVKTLLTMAGHVPEENITTVIVPGLSENPTSSDRALDNLAKVLRDQMDLEEPEFDFYSLLMSGGFKSSNPCLTLASFFFGIELVYIFESSKELQDLHPTIDLSSEEKRQFWQNTWEELAKHGFKNSPSYVHTLLKARLDYPRRSF